MTERRATSTMRRAWQHGSQLRKAATKRDQLRVALGWVLAEVSRRSNHNRTTEVINAVLDLAYRLQRKLPMPEPARGAPTVTTLTAPHAAARRVRGTPPG